MSEISIGERLRRLIKDKGLTAKGFAEITGIAYPTLSHFLNDRRGINMDSISKICMTYPDINPNWIITGSNAGIITIDEPESSLHPKLIESLAKNFPNITAKERVVTVGERLEGIRKALSLTQKDFANILDIQQGSYSDIKRGKVGVSKKIQDKLRMLNVNLEYLLSGEGEIFTGGLPDLKISKEAIIKSENHSLNCNCIRYYDVDASASPVEMFKDKNKVEYQDLCVPGFNDCTIALNVWGDSMLPILKSGEIVMLKEWNESFIEYGHIYMIVTKNNHRMIKYIQPDKSEESVLCESANDFYKPFPIKKEDILKLYVVKGHIERNAI